MKNKFLFQSFAAFCATLMKGRAADCHMLIRMIREIKVPRDRFRGVLVVFFYVAKVFSESVAKSSPCFADVELFAKVQVMQ